VIARVVLGLVVVGAPAAAQRLGARIAAIPTGTVRFTFPARPGLCGGGRAVFPREGHHVDAGQRESEGSEVEYDCEPGPVRVSLTVRHATVQAVRTYVGGRWVSPPPGVAVTDVGAVAPRDAVDFLLALAAGDSSPAGRQAILPATLADSVTVWPALLGLARDERVSRRTRREAVFWLGQATEAAATGGLVDLMSDAAADRHLKEHAVFALSQRPHDESVPALIRLARSHPDRAVRRKAMFWLGQSDDPRALALFQEILTAP
jgi:hypothetical protein